MQERRITATLETEGGLQPPFAYPLRTFALTSCAASTYKGFSVLYLGGGLYPL